MGVHRLIEERGSDLIVGIVGMVITLINAEAAREVYAAARTERRSAVSRPSGADSKSEAECFP
jgi:hypothetical protein